MKLNLTHIVVNLNAMKRKDSLYEPFVFFFYPGKVLSIYTNKEEGRRLVRNISKKNIKETQLKGKSLTIFIK